MARNVWGRLIENSATNLTTAPNNSLSTLTPSATEHPTNPIRSHDNSTKSSNVWWAEGRTLLSVVLWLCLLAVLHYGWMVIRLIALHWKEMSTKPPPEPTYSRERMKFWESRLPTRQCWICWYRSHTNPIHVCFVSAPNLVYHAGSSQYHIGSTARTVFMCVLVYQPRPSPTTNTVWLYNQLT
jgi:hypothetical protein